MSTSARPRQDCHAHSTLSDGADSPDVNVGAAARVGLELFVMVEHVRRNSTHVPALVRTARELDGTRPVRVRAGVEAKILDDRGELDAPDDLDGVDLMAVADHQLPTPTGPISPAQAQELLADGEICQREALGWLLDGTIAAAHRSAADRATVIVHPFSLLPKLGLSESIVSEASLHLIGLELRSIGVGMEVSERWRCPSPHVARCLHSAGVELVPGTDAHAAAAIGRYSYVQDVLDWVPGWRPGPIAEALATG